MQPQRRSRVFIAAVITGQTIVALMFLMFALYQKSEADTNRQLGDRNAKAARAYEEMLMKRIEKQAEQIDSLETELDKLKGITEEK